MLFLHIQCTYLNCIRNGFDIYCALVRDIKYDIMVQCIQNRYRVKNKNSQDLSSSFIIIKLHSLFHILALKYRILWKIWTMTKLLNHDLEILNFLSQDSCFCIYWCLLHITCTHHYHLLRIMIYLCYVMQCQVNNSQLTCA